MTPPLMMFALGFFLSGLSFCNLLVAVDAGRTPLWSAIGVVSAALFALAWLPRIRRSTTQAGTAPG